MLKKMLLALSFVALAPLAAYAENFKEGEHYDLISPPIRTADPDKIEVTEFFWYGCGHCYNFEPLISQWKKTLEDDVAFVGSPAVWNKPMELHAKAYYTAELLGVFDTMHPVLFQAMNVDRKRLASDAEIKQLFTSHGVDGEKFDQAYNSFGVNSQVRQANSRARAAKITGTPEMMVNGKYRITTRKAGSQARMLEIADYLIARERGSGGE